jgi:hypothetical protein
LPEWQAAIKVLMLCSRGGHAMLARIGVMRALHRDVVALVRLRSKRAALGQAEAEERSMTALICRPELLWALC